ncbi:MAG: CDP-glycerol glycerophosphotransferase family protein [Clostridia bacterium]|nr:CDP-glycerol glycerophosphotransferase family protein [Clostridia bacterium]
MIRKMLWKVKDLLRKPFSFVKGLIAENRVKKISSRKIGSDGVIKVAFLVFEPETWEHQECVYKRLKSDKRFKTDVVVIPNFDRNFAVGKTYGAEKEFFISRCGEVILAYDDGGKLYDLKKAGYDYVFYEDQYNRHYPKEYNTFNVCKYAKVCCVPYGYTQGDVFLGCYTKNFFRGVYCLFSTSEQVKEFIVKMFPKGYKKGYRKIVTLGYPTLEKYFDFRECSPKDKILWTPRWSYDKKVGGSHFLEFKDGFKNLKTLYPETEVVFRPHPMMFTEFAQKGYMSEMDAEKYLSELKTNGIIKSVNGSVYDDFKDAEILITDFSSIILFFFLSGRPIIYAPLSTPFFPEFESIINATYKADTWEEVLGYIEKIKNGDDYLKPEREKVIKEFYEKHYGATERIVEFLVNAE